MGNKSREKGKQGEREAARRLGELLGADIRRSQQYKGGDHSADLIGAPGLHLEVKRCERLRLYEALSQAAGDAGGDIPLVIHRPNRRPWVAVCYLDDLPDLAAAVMRIRGG